MKTSRQRILAAQQWLDTPLAKWAKDAAQASVCDNIDVIPQEDEPVFFTD